MPDYKQVREQLSENGYVVIEDFISPEDCTEINSLFWDYMESLTAIVDPQGTSQTIVDRNDKKTWLTKNLPLNTRGLIQHYNVGFQKHAVMTRTLLKPIFEGLYGTPNLLTSFDGTSFSRKPKTHKYKDLQDWAYKCWTKDAIHIDQTTEGFKCIQSGVSIIDQDPCGHVFICVPGSHAYHKEIMSLNGGFTKGDWLIMNEDTKKFLRDKGLELIRVPLKAGSVVLWDSRTVHSSSGYCRSSDPDVSRLQIFVCMLPIPEDQDVYEKEIKKRIKAYNEGRVSRHNPRTISLFGRNPRTYGSEVRDFNIPKSAPLNDDEQKLHGLVRY
jgi:hypothetical protein